MGSSSPWGDIPRLARRLPGRLARRYRRTTATAAAGPSLRLKVRHGALRYWAEIYNPGIRRTWRCHHRHPTRAAAADCAKGMATRINRRGWQRATRAKSPPGTAYSAMASRRSAISPTRRAKITR